MTASRRLLFGIPLLLASTAANAECRLDVFEVSSGAVSARYDPFEAAANPISIALRSTGSDDCAGERVRLTLEPDPSTPTALNGSAILLESGSDTLEAKITDTNGRSAASRGSANGGFALLRFGASGDLRNGDLELQLPPGQRVPPGVYTARLVVTAQHVGDDGVESEPVQSAFDISVTVNAAVGLAAGSATSLDLGTIQTGGTAQDPVSFRAYANTGYDLHVKSDNNFALTLNGQVAAPRIDYVPVLGGQDFSPGAQGVGFADPGSAGFREHLLNVRVPTLEKRPAGTYRDFITVEISATVSG